MLFWDEFIFHNLLIHFLGFSSPCLGEVVDANFGQDPFLFDIIGEMKEQKSKVIHSIENFSTPGRHGDWQVGTRSEFIIAKIIFIVDAFGVRT